MSRAVILIVTLWVKFSCELPDSQGKVEIVMNDLQIINEIKLQDHL